MKLSGLLNRLRAQQNEDEKKEEKSDEMQQQENLDQTKKEVTESQKLSDKIQTIQPKINQFQEISKENQFGENLYAKSSDINLIFPMTIPISNENSAKLQNELKNRQQANQKASKKRQREEEQDENTMEALSPTENAVVIPDLPTIHLELKQSGILKQSVEEFRIALKKNVANNFLKNVAWSPDGSCILTASEDCVLRIFEIDPNRVLYTSQELSAALRIREGETIYDSSWYPLMKSMNPPTCLILSTSNSHPIHLYDAYNGQLKASYRAYDQADELTSALCARFNLSGERIYAGFENVVRVFDVNIPGRPIQTFKVREKRQKKSWTAPKLSLKGLISCIDFNPQNSKMVACGSYSRDIGLFEAETMEPTTILSGHKGGITQIKFSWDGLYLFSGARKDPNICCWDVRQPNEPVFRLPRVCSNNQRLLFDVDPMLNLLFTSSQDGFVLVYDLSTGQNVTSFQISQDCVNGVSCLPISSSGSLLGISTGERKFVVNMQDSIEEEDGEDQMSSPHNGLFLYGYVPQT